MDEDKSKLVCRAMALFHNQCKNGREKERRCELGLRALPGHPFGLSYLVNMRSPHVLWSNHGTDLSCATMALYLEHVVNYSEIDFGLRIIAVPVRDRSHVEHPGGPCHDYYFEFCTDELTLIVGKCADYCSIGNWGRQSLYTMFGGFAELYGGQISYVTLSSVEEGERSLAAVNHWLKRSA